MTKRKDDSGRDRTRASRRACGRLSPLVIGLLAIACTTGPTGDARAPASAITGTTTPPEDRSPATTVPRSAETAEWWAYERPATFDVVQSRVEVPARDGTLLSCRLDRPATNGAPAEGRFPGLIVEFTPYAVLAASFDGEAAFFAQRGYNALVCTVRGTGASGGTWRNAMSSQDGRDAYDLIEWLAIQPFSDGRIGQFGESYGGNTSYAAAVEHPPHLVAIAPMQAPGDLYHDVIYPGGIKTTEGGSIDNWPPIGAALSGGRIDPGEEFATNRAHPTYDGYWRDHTNAAGIPSITVPVLAIGGWDDGYFRSGTLANIEALPARTWAIYGQWPHRSPVDLGGCVACVPDPLPAGVLLAWFDHWVKQLPGLPIPESPTFVSREGPTTNPSSGWRELRWNPAVDGPSYNLGDDGTLTTSTPRPGTVTFHEPREPTDAGGSVTFSTEPLTTDRVLVGHASLSINATLSGGGANLYAELIDVDGQGVETTVNDGYLAVGPPRANDAGTTSTTGDFRLPIRADHHRFAAGHRLRIRLSGGTSKALVPVSLPVVVTITTGSASTLRLPSSW